MNKTIDYQGKKVHYSIEGEGPVLLYLHGYLESSEIWGDFTGRFSNSHTVIKLDIPGHGKSETFGQIHGMEELVKVVARVLLTEGAQKSILIGHSMGGYIVMEFASRFPEMLYGYCLFHSTCFADNEEKKENREREISLVKCGKKMQIVRTNIPKAFAEENLIRLADSVIKAKEIAARTEEEGIVALLRGMKEREDHSETLRKESPPALIIWGRKDNYINEDTFKRMLNLAPHATSVILKNSGHMGFIEEPDCVYTGIVNFLNDLPA